MFFPKGLLRFERVDEPEKQGQITEKVAILVLEEGYKNISQMDAKLKPKWNPKFIQNVPKEPKRAKGAPQR